MNSKIAIQSFDELLHAVEEALRWRLVQYRDPSNLYNPISYGLHGGGKRVRPVMLLMAVQLYKKTVAPAMPVALALEIFHNFTLLHDDIMDVSDQRRGKASVMAKYGLNQTLLSGDAMYALANSILTEAPDHHLSSLVQIFSKMNLEIIEGQQWDMDYETCTQISLQQYIEMIRLKTAILFATALKMGGVLADASEDDCQALYRSGMDIGIAFQLRDDYLDVYGDPKTFGKPIGGDIAENKKTWLYIRAQEISSDLSDSRWKEAQGLINKEEKYRAVKAIYDEYNLTEEGEKLIEKYTTLALEELRLLRGVNPIALKEMEDLYLRLAGRCV